MKAIQNSVIECNKLPSNTITGKPPPPIVSDHNVNPHPKKLDGLQYIESSSDPPWGGTNSTGLLTFPRKMLGEEIIS